MSPTSHEVEILNPLEHTITMALLKRLLACVVCSIQLSEMGVCVSSEDRLFFIC